MFAQLYRATDTAQSKLKTCVCGWQYSLSNVDLCCLTFARHSSMDFVTIFNLKLDLEHRFKLKQVHKNLMFSAHNRVIY